MHHPATRDDPGPQQDTDTAPIDRAGWYVVALLTAIYTCHAIDRAALFVVIEPIKRELHLNDTQMGIISGMAYAVVLAITAVPMGLLADRINRVKLLGVIVIVWSGITGLSSLANGFLSLLLARVGIGAAESGAPATAMSLISDIFPQRRRASVIGIFYFGASMGNAVSFFCGGYLAAAFGWRMAFLIAGAPGILVGILLMLTVREPVRGGTDPASAAITEAAPSFGTALRGIFANPVLLHMFMAIVLAAFTISGVIAWAMPLLIREHGFSLSQAGMLVGLGTASQAIGAGLCGFAADALGRQKAYRSLLVPAGVLLLMVPAGVAFSFAQSSGVVIAAFLVLGVLLSGWVGPAYGTVLGEVDPRLRGTTMSVYQIGATLTGAGMGPTVVGALSDIYRGPNPLGKAIATSVAFGIWGSVHFALALWTQRRRARAYPGAEPQPQARER